MSRARFWGALLVTMVVLAGAVVGGLASPTTGGAPVMFVERLSSGMTDLFSRAQGVWWTYGFFLGMVAAFNPCGFALLPAYLGLYLNDQQARSSITARVRRALTVSVWVAGAFTVLFGVIGGLFSFASRLILPSLPWAGLGVGVLLILIGGATLAGLTSRFIILQQGADRLGPTAGRSGVRGYAAFGLAYGLISLGCALPLFLGLVGAAVAAGGPWTALAAFALFGVGMATTLGVLTLIAGLVSTEVFARVRGLTRFVVPLGGALLLVSGAYVVFYWLTAGRFLLT